MILHITAAYNSNKKSCPIGSTGIPMAAKRLNGVWMVVRKSDMPNISEIVNKLCVYAEEVDADLSRQGKEETTQTIYVPIKY